MLLLKFGKKNHFYDAFFNLFPETILITHENNKIIFFECLLVLRIYKINLNFLIFFI